MSSKWQIMITVIRLVLLGVLVTLIWQALPQRLDVTLGESQTVTHTRTGSFAVTITLLPQGNDNGSVAIEVLSNGQLVGTLQSQYNYDFFSNQPAGWLRRTWVDSDWQRDILLTTSANEETHFVSSIDGKLY